MKVIVRRFKVFEDSGIIFSTFPKGVYYGLETIPEEPKREWFSRYYETTRELLENADIRIACRDDDHDFIVGYAIINFDTCEFVYVKEGYRKQGIATLLIPDNINKFNNITKIGKVILDARNSRTIKEETRTEAETDRSTILHDESGNGD